MIDGAVIRPDKELKRMLEGNITIHTSVADTAPVTVYRHGERPNTGLPDHFIDISVNGVIPSLTFPAGVFRGNIAVSVYCRTNSNGSVNDKRIDEIVRQLWVAVDRRKSGDFFFSFDLSNVITPDSQNVTAGYSVTALNVEWTMYERGDGDGE